ncbi:hypothetical protein HK104_000633 [Borealophlyctis nickersoniae]|nr:hypothetical protein HK104_000633 [Borealophlyctis nickersoniae]
MYKKVRARSRRDAQLTDLILSKSSWEDAAAEAVKGKKDAERRAEALEAKVKEQAEEIKRLRGEIADLKRDADFEEFLSLIRL